MSDTWFIFAGFLFFAAIGIVLLLWPSAFLRHIQNPSQPDTPINRVHIRALGVLICLFVLLPFSEPFEGFHRNILLAMYASFVILPVFLWILWRYSPLQRVNRRCLTGESEEPQWELRMGIAFCSLLSVIVLTAFLLGMSGIYPK